MTYYPDFEKDIRCFSDVFNNRVINKKIIYCGELEKTEGDIKLFNYKNIAEFGLKVENKSTM